MGTFKIINQTTGEQSKEVCSEWNCLATRSFTVKKGDILSLFYDFGFDLQVTPNTKVHFMYKEATGNVDARISPSGADKMNNEGWVNPTLADILAPGTFEMYAYDEYYNKGTNVITLTVLPAGAAPTCLKEGEYNVPYLGKDCCPGLQTGWDLKCTPIATTKDKYEIYGSGCGSGTKYSVAKNGTHFGYDQPSCPDVNAYFTNKYPNADVYINGSLVSGSCQPPNSVQRKCIDANTIGVWNQVDCKYDTAPCSTGTQCSNGNCIQSTAGPRTVRIVINGNGIVKSSGGDNLLAVRNSITVPSGYQVYFEAIPSPGSTFLKFVSADGVTTTTNPITLPVSTDGTITVFFSGQQPDKKYKCVSGVCKENSTGTFTTPTCNDQCAGATTSDGMTPTLLLIAFGIAAAIIIKRKRS